MLFFTLAVIFPLSMLPRMRHVSGAGTVGWYATCAARLASRLVCCVCGTAGQQASLPRVQQGWPGQRWLHAAHRRRRAADPDAVHGQSSALTASHLSLSALRTLLFFLTSLTQLEMVGNCGIFILLALAGGCLAAKVCTRLLVEVHAPVYTAQPAAAQLLVPGALHLSPCLRRQARGVRLQGTCKRGWRRPGACDAADAGHLPPASYHELDAASRLPRPLL